MSEEYILEKAAHLAAAFQNSALYKDYTLYRAALKNDPALYAQVQAYKKAQAEYEYKRLGEKDNADFTEEKRISHLYTELSLHECAGPFLACENKLLDLYKQTFDLLCEACRIDLGLG